MVKKTKVHFAWNEVKTSILELILDSSGPISEPSIREQLYEKYGAADQGLINRQLHSLESIGCVESVSPGKKSRSNYWDIKKLKNLKNVSDHFKEIELKKYEKPIGIIIKDLFFDASPDNKDAIFEQLSTSTSFFNLCIKSGTDIKAFYVNAKKLYQYDEGFEIAQDVKESVKDLHIEFLKRILINPNYIGVNDSSRLDIDQILLKYYPYIAISEERFRALLEEIQIISGGNMSAEELNQIIMKEISLKFLSEISQNALKAVPTEFLKISEETLSKVSVEIFKRAMEGNPEEMCRNFLALKFYQRIASMWSPYLIFKHCFYQDIINGTVSPEEIDVVCNHKNRAVELDKGSENEQKSIQTSHALYAFIQKLGCMF